MQVHQQNLARSALKLPPNPQMHLFTSPGNSPPLDMRNADDVKSLEKQWAMATAGSSEVLATAVNEADKCSFALVWYKARSRPHWPTHGAHASPLQAMRTRYNVCLNIRRAASPVHERVVGFFNHMKATVAVHQPDTSLLVIPPPQHVYPGT